VIKVIIYKLAWFSLIFLVFVISPAAWAGAVYVNNTGEVACGFRIMFSEPVEITSYSTVFPNQTPLAKAIEFVFTGGEIPPGGSFWLSWKPASVHIVSTTWLHFSSQQEETPLEEFQVETTSLAGKICKFRVRRYVEQRKIPFVVRYQVIFDSVPKDLEVHWDLDKYVDTDGDGDPQNDSDMVGRSFELYYDENFNPTITLWLTKEGVPFCKWESMLKNDFFVDTQIQLDGKALLALHGISEADVISAVWSQQHMERMDLEYMTENEAKLFDEDKLSAVFCAQHPGKFVFTLSATLRTGIKVSYSVRAWVTMNWTRRIPVGFMMQDIWNECYDTGQNAMVNCARFFSDKQWQEKLNYLRLQGFQHVIVVNQNALVEVKPDPKISTVGPEIHYINQNDLQNIFSHITYGHIVWQPWYFGKNNRNYWYDFNNRTKAYYEKFFAQYSAQIIADAHFAEDQGLASFTFAYEHPYWEGLCKLINMNSQMGQWMAKQWAALMRQIRSTFSQKVGVGMPPMCKCTLELSEYIDFFLINLEFKMTNTPGDLVRRLHMASSVAELQEAYSDYLDRVLRPISDYFGKPLWIAFWPLSHVNAAKTGWTPQLEHTSYKAWRETFSVPGHGTLILKGATFPAEYKPSFKEQVKLIEALMPALGSKDYVAAIFAHYEYWKLLNFKDFTPNNILDHAQIVLGTLQGKPGFEIYKLWASIFNPSDGLQYRKALPIPLQ